MEKRTCGLCKHLRLCVKFSVLIFYAFSNRVSMILLRCRFSMLLLWNIISTLVSYGWWFNLVKYSGWWLYICAGSLKHYFDIGLIWLVVGSGQLRWFLGVYIYVPALWNIISTVVSYGWLSVEVKYGGSWVCAVIGACSLCELQRLSLDGSTFSPTIQNWKIPKQSTSQLKINQSEIKVE